MRKRGLMTPCRWWNTFWRIFQTPTPLGSYFTSDDHGELITRLKDMHDNATPCANAVMASVLVRLGRICSRSDYVDLARQLVQGAAGVIDRAPLAAGQWLLALDELIGPAQEVVLVAGDRHDSSREILSALRRQYQPNTIVLFRDSATAYRSQHLAAMFRDRESRGELTAYVCQGSTCQAPLVGKAPIGERLLE